MSNTNTVNIPYPSTCWCTAMDLQAKFALHEQSARDTLAEWLRRRPAKPMGSPRVGSNPTGVACNRVGVGHRCVVGFDVRLNPHNVTYHALMPIGSIHTSHARGMLELIHACVCIMQYRDTCVATTQRLNYNTPSMRTRTYFKYLGHRLR